LARLARDADLDGPRTLSLSFPRATSLRIVLQLLVRGTPFSTVVPSSLRGTFSGEVRHLTLRQALEAVLHPSGLEYEVVGTVIRVFPRRPVTRFFPIDILAVRRSWQSRAGAPGAVVSFAETDPLAAIDNGVRALLSAEGRHYVDRQAGVVQVTDFVERLDQVALYLETVQLRSSRQIRIDARILRVAAKDPGSALAAGPALVRDVARFVADLERFATVQTIASPRMLSLNNQPAFVQISSETGQEHSLIVTPQISADRVVVLGIVPRIDDRTGASPDAGTRQSVLASDSVVRVQPGETAVISAFPRSQGSADQHEILVLLTPSIVVPATGQEGRQ
jgi:type II secretory pathway component GspD/PulD (secretin)